MFAFTRYVQWYYFRPKLPPNCVANIDIDAAQACKPPTDLVEPPMPQRAYTQ